MKPNITTFEAFKKWFSMEAPKMTPDALRSYLNSFKGYNTKTCLGSYLYEDEIKLCENLLNLKNGTNEN